jgi:inorganic pyrophosphatase
MSKNVSLSLRTAATYLVSMKSIALLLLYSCFLGGHCSTYRAVVAGAPVSASARVLDDETIAGARHYSLGYSARSDNGVHAVVEIPTGTTAKFDVQENDGYLHWAKKREDGSRREIDYLAYPINYGMVPNTLAADGDALDIMVLGRGIERGRVVDTRVIGVLMMQHDGTRDDKMIAVNIEDDLRNGFSTLTDLAQIDESYPEVRQILWLWFSNYWGRGATEVIGWGNAAAAETIVEQAIESGANLLSARFRDPVVASNFAPFAVSPHLAAALPF